MKICLVAHFAYSAISGNHRGHAGGVERQASLMGRWLASRGHQVSVLTWDEGGEREEVVNGVRIMKMCRRDAGIPGLRFFVPRWSSLVRGLRSADANLYFHNCAEYVTGQVAIWCRTNDRRFVYSAASDMDCDAKLSALRTGRERVLYRYGLRHADKIIVQTQHQAKLMRDNFGLTTQVIPMPCAGPIDRDYAPPSFPKEPRVLWVGRISPEKRLDLLLDVARDNPRIHFDVAGKPDRPTEYSENLLTRARSLANVSVLGKVAWNETPNLYKSASLLCSTSLYEGFPNVFLEAWSHGVPIVSTVDPDGVITKHSLGTFASPEDVSSSIKKLLTDPVAWTECSKNARRYYREFHSAEEVLPRFEQMFLELVGEPKTKAQIA
jgi:glycosyltransferase involved in cell wall biosynthesis